MMVHSCTHLWAEPQLHFSEFKSGLLCIARQGYIMRFQRKTTYLFSVFAPRLVPCCVSVCSQASVPLCEHVSLLACGNLLGFLQGDICVLGLSWGKLHFSKVYPKSGAARSHVKFIWLVLFLRHLKCQNYRHSTRSMQCWDSIYLSIYHLFVYLHNFIFGSWKQGFSV